MKKKDLADIRNKTIAELEALAIQLRKDISQAKMETAVRKNKNTNAAGGFLKSLAQVLTIKKEKELAQQAVK